VTLGSLQPLRHRLDIHDRKQFEIKLEYIPSGADPTSKYLIETYLFLPASLNVDAETYPRQDFYADIHNYLRLKTPVMGFSEILAGKKSPLVVLEAIVRELRIPPEPELVYQTKLLSCCFRGALRRFGQIVDVSCQEAANADGQSLDSLQGAVNECIKNVNELLIRFRDVTQALLTRYILVEKTKASIRLVDEYMSLTVEQFLRKSVAQMGRLPRTTTSVEMRKQLMTLVIAEERYRKNNQLRSVISPGGDNEEYMHRIGFLKKFCMNILFLAVRREQGSNVEEVAFAVAAGLAMAFATIVAFWGQQQFPQVSLNFFLILVVGYMMKDRIKEGLRRIFVSYAQRHLFDRTTFILDPVTKKRLGYCKEKVDYRSLVPDQIHKLRRTDDFTTVSAGELSESTIRYQKQIVLNSNQLPRVTEGVPGVTDIIRLNVDRLLRDMDDPEYALEYVDLEDYSVGRVKASKSYQVDLAFRFAVDDADLKTVSFQLVRLILDRNGIKRMLRFDPVSHPEASPGTPTQPGTIRSVA
jgi:hypothetical protein